MGKQKNWILILSIVFLSLSVLINSACFYVIPYYNRQQNLKNVIWKSEENECGLYLEYTVLQERGCHFGYVEYLNEKKDIALEWGDSSFSVDSISYYGERYTLIDFGGGYNILSDDRVELEILIDDMFDGALENKKIVVSASAIDGDSYDVSYRQELCWESENNYLQLYTYQYTRRFCVGSYGPEDDRKSIVLYWLENSCFKAYELIDGEQQEAVLLSGTYESEGTDVKLIFDESSINAPSSAELTGREISVGEYPQKIWYPKTEEQI